MAARFVNIDYDTPLFLPPNLRDWVPAGHLAHFILDSVEGMDLRQVRVNERGSGCPQYPPRMLLALLLYCYATGVFSSRRIEQASSDSVPGRLICGDTQPDHDTICTFRRDNKALLQETFVRVLVLAQELKFLRVGQITVAVDGTKVLANASKHAAVSYEHAGKTIQQLDGEVKELLAKAEQADSTPLEDGLTIPEEIQRRQERQAKLAAARTEIEARAQARAAAEMAEYKAKLEERASDKNSSTSFISCCFDIPFFKSSIVLPVIFSASKLECSGKLTLTCLDSCILSSVLRIDSSVISWKLFLNISPFVSMSRQ